MGNELTLIIWCLLLGWNLSSALHINFSLLDEDY